MKTNVECGWCDGLVTVTNKWYCRAKCSRCGAKHVVVFTTCWAYIGRVHDQRDHGLAPKQADWRAGWLVDKN